MPIISAGASPVSNQYECKKSYRELMRPPAYKNKHDKLGSRKAAGVLGGLFLLVGEWSDFLLDRIFTDKCKFCMSQILASSARSKLLEIIHQVRIKLGISQLDRICIPKVPWSLKAKRRPLHRGCQDLSSWSNWDMGTQLNPDPALDLTVRRSS